MKVLTKYTAALLFLVSIMLLPVSNGKAAETIDSVFQVKNLSCGSCLARINFNIRRYDPRAKIITANIGKGGIIVAHSPSFMPRELLAFIISDLGYPATVISPSDALHKELFKKNYSSAGGLASQGSTCCSSGSCGATSSSWKALYKRYFGKNK